MAILLMLGWWYSQGWFWIVQLTQKRLKKVSHTFAVSVLIRTLFSPWKQIYTKSTFRTYFRDMADNAVSRGIGAIVRGAILFYALILSFFIVLFGILSLIIWPFIPLAIFIFPVLALAGVSF